MLCPCRLMVIEKIKLMLHATLDDVAVEFCDAPMSNSARRARSGMCSSRILQQWFCDVAVIFFCCCKIFWTVVTWNWASSGNPPTPNATVSNIDLWFIHLLSTHLICASCKGWSCTYVLYLVNTVGWYSRVAERPGQTVCIQTHANLIRWTVLQFVARPTTAGVEINGRSFWISILGLRLTILLACAVFFFFWKKRVQYFRQHLIYLYIYSKIKWLDTVTAIKMHACVALRLVWPVRLTRQSHLHLHGRRRPSPAHGYPSS